MTDTTKKCIRCGAALPEEAAFCPVCTATQIQRRTISVTPPTTRRNQWWIGALTALVALERAKLTDTITVTASHMVEGSSMYLKPGETVTVEELLYGLMLCSGNDAALALADCCGGLDAFVQAMNEKAAALGMKDTSFANPNGLDDENHYSTARDMAVLAAYAAEDPTFRRICSTKTATVGGRSMTNHNKLLRQIEGCIGMKTGYTKAAGRTLVSCAERQGRRLVAVTLCDGNDWADHAALYEFGFGP